MIILVGGSNIIFSTIMNYKCLKYLTFQQIRKKKEKSYSIFQIFDFETYMIDILIYISDLYIFKGTNKTHLSMDGLGGRRISRIIQS